MNHEVIGEINLNRGVNVFTRTEINISMSVSNHRPRAYCALKEDKDRLGFYLEHFPAGVALCPISGELMDIEPAYINIIAGKILSQEGEPYVRTCVEDISNRQRADVASTDIPPDFINPMEQHGSELHHQTGTQE